mmetsp:Transcript_559/g.1754  ORF Transcript_559/g.1754 Transcript_559/m.1754 type:complete len:410 (+) Transcript_559:632-1861(+)
MRPHGGLLRRHGGGHGLHGGDRADEDARDARLAGGARHQRRPPHGALHRPLGPGPRRPRLARRGRPRGPPAGLLPLMPLGARGPRVGQVQGDAGPPQGGARHPQGALRRRPRRDRDHPEGLGGTGRDAGGPQGRGGEAHDLRDGRLQVQAPDPAEHRHRHFHPRHEGPLRSRRDRRLHRHVHGGLHGREPGARVGGGHAGHEARGSRARVLLAPRQVRTATTPDRFRHRMHDWPGDRGWRLPDGPQELGHRLRLPLLRPLLQHRPRPGGARLRRGDPPDQRSRRRDGHDHHPGAHRGRLPAELCPDPLQHGSGAAVRGLRVLQLRRHDLLLHVLPGDQRRHAGGRQQCARAPPHAQGHQEDQEAEGHAAGGLRLALTDQEVATRNPHTHTPTPAAWAAVRLGAARPTRP